RKSRRSIAITNNREGHNPEFVVISTADDPTAHEAFLHWLDFSADLQSARVQRPNDIGLQLETPEPRFEVRREMVPLAHARRHTDQLHVPTPGRPRNRLRPGQSRRRPAQSRRTA